ncbi:MAG TPA: cytochrome c biogenesis protein CcsA, partial [Gemmatimonadaceae bacterium]|nr:cytochrome c biogenesis protein CcsA [Gemmatimonadaceae bacterium]
RALLYTPADAALGPVQRLFYVHVPSAILGMYVACTVMAIAGGLYLWLKDARLDRIAEASAEVGFVFLTVVLVTGSIWGKASWGTYWAWEPRLTSALFLWFVVLSYLVLRDALENPETKARLSAVLGVLALLLVPFIHMTVYLFRGLHPEPIVLKPSKPSLSPEMLTTFLLAIAAFTLLFFALIRVRYQWAVARDARLALEHA